MREQADSKTQRPPRNVVAPNFGRQLRRLRGHHSRAEICRWLEGYGLTVDRSTLLQYERGTVASPDPAIVWALCRLYQQHSCDELITVLVMDRTGRGLRDPQYELAMPRFTLQQLHVAEVFGTLDAGMRDAFITLLEALLSKSPPQSSSSTNHRSSSREA